MRDLPKDFIELIQNQFPSEADDLLNSLQTEATLSLRINPFKSQAKSNFKRIPWSDTGYYLEERPAYTYDPAFHAGAYYPQESSSMFVEYLLKKKIIKDDQPLRVLDLCAAPGGKSTLISTILPENSLIVANEVNNFRNTILIENLQKWGIANYIVSHNDPQDFAGITGVFDVVLTDAPCSGEGMFRKQMDAREEWSMDNVNLCQKRQRRIVMDAWNCIKPGGYLIYSTCTFNLNENEENIAWICENTSAESIKLDDLPENVYEKLYKNIYGYHFFPHQNDGEGFFISLIQKPHNISQGKEKKIKRPKLIKSKAGFEFFKSMLNLENKVILEYDNRIYCLPETEFDFVNSLAETLRITSAGQHIGDYMRNDIQVAHGLATSVGLRNDLIPSLELNLEDALQYLSRETLQIEKNLKGTLLLKYNGFNLGFGKAVNGRLNNNYPKNWRIRNKKFIEEQEVVKAK